MPTIQFPLRFDGAFLDVGIGASRAVTGATNRPYTKMALIDTGCDVTVISPSVVLYLNPQQIGKIPITRAGGGTSWNDSFDVRIHFGGHRGAGALV
jgi:hypothetical protein